MAEQLKRSFDLTGLVAGVPVIVAHGLNWNSRPVIPDVIFLSVGGFDVTATDTTITVTRRFDGPDAVTLLAESWHTYERGFGSVSTTVLSPQPFVFDGSTGVLTGNYITGLAEVGGVTQPTEVTKEFFVQSDEEYPGFVMTSVHGQDNLGGGWGESAAKPFRTLQYALGRLERGAREGAIAEIMLMGSGGPDIEHPAVGRAIRTRGFTNGGVVGEQYRTSVILRGPRGGITVGGGQTLVGAVNVSSRMVKLTFSGAGGFDGSFVRTTLPDGRRKWFNWPIMRDNQVVRWDSGGAAADWAALAAIPGVEIQPIQPAIFITADGGDARMNGVLINGGPGFEPGARSGTVAPTYTSNVLPFLADVGVGVRAVFKNCYGCIDGCRLDDHKTFEGGKVWLRMNYVTTALNFFSTGAYLSAASAGDHYQMPAGRLIPVGGVIENSLGIHRNDGTCDPDDPVVGCDFVVGQLGAIGVGRTLGGPATALRIVKAAGVSYPGTTAINVYDSIFTQLPLASLVIEISPGAPNATALWVRGGGKAYIAPVVATSDYFNIVGRGGGANNDLRVGVGAAISLADFVDVTKWGARGLFSRGVYDVTNTYPQDDPAFIRDISSAAGYAMPPGADVLPAGYWNGE